MGAHFRDGARVGVAMGGVGHDPLDGGAGVLEVGQARRLLLVEHGDVEAELGGEDRGALPWL